MRAVLHRSYGSPDVLELEDVDKPTPSDDEVLIRVRAASVNPLDWHLMRAEPYPMRAMTGWRKPKDTRVGLDVAGDVEAVGKNVTRLQPGDEVFGAAKGALADYVCASETRLAHKPTNATFEEAAAVPVAGVTALQGLRDKGRLRAGEKTLVNGAAGGVGTFTVQIAKSLGADVTAVCSTRNIDTVLSIGADRVVDYTREDFTRGDERYDLLFDCMGNRPLSACRRLMSPGGRYVVVGGPSGRFFAPLVRPVEVLLWSPFVSQKLVTFTASILQQDLVSLKELIESGKVTPVIDRRYPMAQAADAIRYLEEGHARGKVVITFDDDRKTS